MINGVTLGGKHCYKDFRLVLSGRSIGLPEVQATSVTVPGRDGSLDLTEALDGMVHYSNRTIQLTFTTFQPMTQKAWHEVLSSFAGHVHGQMLQIVFDEDTDYYYQGRCSISKYALDTATTQQEFTVECDCQPFKMAFEDSIFVANVNPAERELNIVNGRKPVVPTIIATVPCIVRYGDTEFTLDAGTTCSKDIQLAPGTNTVYARTVSDAGTVTVRYKKGEL